MQDIKNLVPLAQQLVDYTYCQVVPPVAKVVFKPGGGRGRPLKGREALVFEEMEHVQQAMIDQTYKAYKRILVYFKGDSRYYEAHIETCYEKRMLVIEGVGIVTSVIP